MGLDFLLPGQPELVNTYVLALSILSVIWGSTIPLWGVVIKINTENKTQRFVSMWADYKYPMISDIKLIFSSS